MTKNTISLYGTKSPDYTVKLPKSKKELKESFEQLLSQKNDEKIKKLHQIIKKLTNIPTRQWIQSLVENDSQKRLLLK